MNNLRKVFDFYIFSNVHVALSGYALTQITLIQMGVSERLSAYFVGFSILLSYNFIRYYEINRAQDHWFKSWFKRHKILLIIVATLSLISLVNVMASNKFNLKGLLILIPFGFMTFFYVIPIYKSKSLVISFRNTAYIKIWSIALAWAGVTVLFPVYEAALPISNEVLILFLQRFLFLVALLIPFDIRDIKFDLPSLKTLPQILGVRQSKLLGTFFLLIYLMMEFLYFKNISTATLIRCVIVLVTAMFIWMSSEKRNKYYTSFFVEGIPILWFILIELLLEH